VNRRVHVRFLILILGSTGITLLGLAVQRVDLVLIASALGAIAVVGSVLHQWPDFSIDLTAPRRAVQHDIIDIVVTIASKTPAPWVQVELELPAGLVPVLGHTTTVVAVPAHHQVTLTFQVKATEWGVVIPGRLIVTYRDRFGLFSSSSVHHPQPRIAVHPNAKNRRSEIVPQKLRSRVGTHRSSGHGEGSDFAEVRPMRIGDSPKALNWRVTARKREPWITVRHPERSGDLVVLLDSFCDLGSPDNRMVQRAVKAAMALTESNLDQHDRVGLLDVGHRVRWFRPRTGRHHRARLLDALLQTQVEPRPSPPSMSLFPLHDLDDATTIVMLTGLADKSMSQRPLELRHRGLDVAVLEIDANDHHGQLEYPVDLAARLWDLQRNERRRTLVKHGVPVVTWSAHQPVELAVAALAQRHRAPHR